MCDGRLVIQLDPASSPVHLVGTRADQLADTSQQEEGYADRREKGKVNEYTDQPDQPSDEGELGR